MKIGLDAVSLPNFVTAAEGALGAPARRSPTSTSSAAST